MRAIGSWRYADGSMAAIAVGWFTIHNVILRGYKK